MIITRDVTTHWPVLKVPTLINITFLEWISWLALNSFRFSLFSLLVDIAGRPQIQVISYGFFFGRFDVFLAFYLFNFPINSLLLQWIFLLLWFWSDLLIHLKDYWPMLRLIHPKLVKITHWLMLSFVVIDLVVICTYYGLLVILNWIYKGINPLALLGKCSSFIIKVLRGP